MIQPWILTRHDNQQTVHLHGQFVWRDEYDWTPIAQSSPVYLMSGAMDIQQGTKLAGRPITLDGEHVWLKRQEIRALQALAAVPELTFTLTHPDGRTFDVMFARPFIDGIKPVKIIRPSDEAADDNYTANLHFLTV